MTDTVIGNGRCVGVNYTNSNPSMINSLANTPTPVHNIYLCARSRYHLQHPWSSLDSHPSSQ
ncbi:hypothetical protein PILCRDRAFT_829704 [Piloderma croceum F 1598]|uniref:Uncharacterized protein n=1 Tax=Piloderma croceum (strain F 1598) TaxID=765440 RepID=A0A0C3EXK7_PILCF|nr:hypothetical protein PILCRDRAFT_829704 [Piloderma croceum F 1598]